MSEISLDYVSENLTDILTQSLFYNLMRNGIPADQKLSFDFGRLHLKIYLFYDFHNVP